MNAVFQTWQPLEVAGANTYCCSLFVATFELTDVFYP